MPRSTLQDSEKILFAIPKSARELLEHSQPCENELPLDKVTLVF
jgi:hypothetical protein